MSVCTQDTIKLTWRPIWDIEAYLLKDTTDHKFNSCLRVSRSFYFILIESLQVYRQVDQYKFVNMDLGGLVRYTAMSINIKFVIMDPGVVRLSPIPFASRYIPWCRTMFLGSYHAISWNVSKRWFSVTLILQILTVVPICASHKMVGLCVFHASNILFVQ